MERLFNAWDWFQSRDKATRSMLIGMVGLVVLILLGLVFG